MSDDKTVKFLRQLKSFIDEFLDDYDQPEKEEPIPTVVQSSEIVYTQISELPHDLQIDYAKADKEMKRHIEKKWNLKPSE